MKRILVVNVNWLGDVVMTTPIFRSLKRAFPQAHIVCLAVPRVRDILESSSDIDEIIDYDEDGRHKGILGHWKLIRSLRRKKFDTAFLLHRSRTRAFLAFCAGIPTRIGYDTKKLGALLTQKVTPLEGNVHKVDYYFHVIEAAGISDEKPVSVLHYEEAALQSIEQRFLNFGIQADERVVVFHVGANWKFKQWPVEYFIELACLIQRLGNVRVIVSGGRADQEAAKRIQSEVPGLFSLVGEINVKELVALLYRADVVVSADSGPMHIASSVGTDVVALFGPTRPADSGPRGRGRSMVLHEDVDCAQGECYVVNCSDHRCMRAITSQKVFDAVVQCLGTQGEGADD